MNTFLLTSCRTIAVTASLFVGQANAAPEKLGGGWYATEDGEQKLGLVGTPDSPHYSFFYGECGKLYGRVVAEFSLDIEPILWADAITKTSYININVDNGKTRKTLIATKILLNDLGENAWIISFPVGDDDLQHWADGPKLIFSLAVGEETRKEYLMPNENRQAAIAAFSSKCFGTDAAPPPQAIQPPAPPLPQAPAPYWPPVPAPEPQRPWPRR